MISDQKEKCRVDSSFLKITKEKLSFFLKKAQIFSAKLYHLIADKANGDHISRSC